MNHFKMLTYCLKIVNYPLLNEAGGAYFSSLSRNVTCMRFCSTATVSTENTKEKPSVLDPVDKLSLTDYVSAVPKKFNFAMVADKSPLVQKYIELGVNLYEVQKNPDAAKFLITLNMEKMKPYLFFLTDNGVPADGLGDFITKNPTIFKEDLDDLEVRINYLKSKKFDQNMISTILTKYPKWLSIPVKKIDERLGYLQVTFHLTGDQIRGIITRVPSLTNVKKEIIMTNTHVLKEQMNLDKYALKKIILSEPHLLRINSYDLIETFDYLTETMKVSKELVINQPKVLTCRKYRLEERHKFLVSLGRAQYCHFLPGYVSLLSLVESSDVEFCEKIARTSVELFNNFLKTL